MSSNNSKLIKDSVNELPKVQSACSKCVGYIKNCDNCGEKIEILNHRPLNYHEGSLHRCLQKREGGIASKPMSILLQLKINPEYQKLVPEMSKQDFETLKSDIKEKGQFFPIIVTSKGVILDGHHRYKVCQELGIKCIFVVKDFENELQEKLFVIDSNLKRRHLNSFQKTELL